MDVSIASVALTLARVGREKRRMGKPFYSITVRTWGTCARAFDREREFTKDCLSLHRQHSGLLGPRR